MTTISDENGIINNFAKEPAMYYAETPSSQEQKGYLAVSYTHLTLPTILRV